MSLVKGVLQFHSSTNGIMRLSQAWRKIRCGCERDDEDGSWSGGVSRIAVTHTHVHIYVCVYMYMHIQIQT